MEPSLTDTLCTRCGLCCDGTLFADVELAGESEATGLEILGLEIEDDDAEGPLLVLPCTALQGTMCRIYPHRPECCRTFECRLLQDVRRGTVEVERAAEVIVETHRRIGEVREQIAELDPRDRRLSLRERCAEAVVRGTRARPETAQKRAELEVAMVALESLIRKTFLASGESETL